jgi:hypothetical protein
MSGARGASGMRGARGASGNIRLENRRRANTVEDMHTVTTQLRHERRLLTRDEAAALLQLEDNCPDGHATTKRSGGLATSRRDATTKG